VAYVQYIMSRLDELPPDQRAALALLLRQRKSYADVAAMLGISEHAVHDRAHAAIAVLAPRLAREVTPAQRVEIGDYLLSQQSVGERLRTRTYLAGSESATAWAREIAAQLAPLSGTPLPEIPDAAPPPQRLQDLSSSPSPPVASAAPARSLPSSRVGGAVLLAVIAAVVVVAVILLTDGSSHTKNSSKTSSTASTKTGPTVENQITLKPPTSKSGSVGVVDVLEEGGKRAFFIEAQHLPRSKGFYYAIWLYNSPTSALPLSKSPAVGSTHRLAGGSLLPTSAGEYKEILVTKETNPHPTHPGKVVLRGKFSLS
jgi:hypothetical protein